MSFQPTIALRYCSIESAAIFRGVAIMTENSHHFCMQPTPGKFEGQTKAFLLDALKWQPGTQVKVRFMGGDPGLQKRVAEVAKKWTGPQMANVGLQFVDSGDADVRIAFQQ